MKKISLLIVMSIFVLTSCQESSTNYDLIIDINTIIGKDILEVEKVLGKVENLEKFKGYPCEESSCEIGFFKEGKYEIIFKENKADRITIYDVPRLATNKDAITALGLPKSEPSFINPGYLIRWQEVNNIYEIDINYDFILIQATKPD